MRILINYDLMNAIRDVNEPMGPSKIIRNEKDKYIVKFPVFLSIDMLMLRDLGLSLGGLSIWYLLLMGSDLIINTDRGYDIYQRKAKNNLNKLVNELNNYNIRTNYEMILETKECGSRYRVDEFRKLKVVHERYLSMPVTNYHGALDDIDILQEHVMGSNEYVLSLGSNEKKKALVKRLV